MASSVAVDWTRVLTKCNPVVRKGIMDLRSRHEDLRRLISEAKQTMPKLDFGYYKANLSGKEFQKLLTESEEKVKSYKPQRIDVSQQVKELEAQKQDKLKVASNYLSKLQGDIQNLQLQIKKLQAAKPVDEMTVDDVYELRPELKAQIYDCIKNDNWATTDDKDIVIPNKGH